MNRTSESMEIQDEDQIGERVDQLRRRIVAALKPTQIVLFGSHARGEARPDSDVDLLVVHDTDRTNRDVRRQLEQLFLDRRFGLDLIVRTPEEVRRNVADGNPFYTRHIFDEGQVLYSTGKSTRRACKTRPFRGGKSCRCANPSRRSK